MPDQSIDRRIQLLLWHDLRHEADSQGDAGIETFTGEEIPAGLGGADPTQDEGRDHSRHDPQADLGETEKGSFGCDSCIGCRCQARAAPEGSSVNRHHDRYWRAIDRFEDSSISFW